MNEEPGVLGNLPRSRPGRRSAKRGDSSQATTPKATPARATPKARRTPAKRRRPPARPAPSRQQPRSVAAPANPRGTDPVSEAVRLAARLADVGFKTAGGILRRMPRL